MKSLRLSRLIACIALVAGAGVGYRASGGPLGSADTPFSIHGIEMPEGTVARQALARQRARFEPWLLGPSGIARIERAGDWLRPVSADTSGSVADQAVNLALPERADRPFRLADGSPGMSVEVTLLGLAPAPAEVAEGFVVYRRAHASGGDLLQRPTPTGTEDYLVFEAPPEKPGMTYSIALGTGVAGLRLVANTLEFLDESGAPHLRMSSPFIMGRDGAVHDASVAVTDCAFDSSSAAPWGRPVTAPGATRCTVSLEWAVKGLGYPAILDPSWTATVNNLSVARMNHTGTLLNPALDPLHVGKVLIAGGRTASGTRTRTTELYNPASNSFAVTGSMSCARELHTATLLGDGRVLVVGGLSSGDGLPGGAPDTACPAAEAYNPTTGTWTLLTLTTALPIWGHAASRIEAGLQSGKVLITGGRTALGSKPTSGAYLFDPQTNTTQKIPSLPASRYLHGQALQRSGGLVMVGGGRCPDCDAIAASFEANTDVADPTKIKWSSQSSSVSSGEGPVLLRLFSNSALIFGGGNAGSATDTAQVHVFGSQGWKNTGSMSTGRNQTAGALLTDGRVIVAGGRNGAGTVLASAEIWDPTTGSWTTDSSVIAPMNLPRAAHTLTAMQAGKVLAAGGFTTGGAVTDTAEVFGVASGPPLCNPPCGAGSECQPSGVCAPTTCSTGTADCNGNVADGCEANLGDPNNCGTCGNVCSLNGACAASGDSHSCACNPGYAGNGNTCGDINECAAPGTCAAGFACTNTPGSFTCADINECAAPGTCAAGFACTNTPGSFTCADINECAAPGTCAAGFTCTNTPGSFTCTDIDECLTNTDNCHDATMNCVNTPGSYTCVCKAGLGDCNGVISDGCEVNLSIDSNHCGGCAVSCDDGSACTNDSCAAGSCTHGSVVCTGSDQCHSAGTCDPATGVCSSTARPDGTACSDGNACTTVDVCNGGSCVGSTPPNCNDGNVCTDDACNPASGCFNTNNSAACNDGNACTTVDVCAGGTCVGSTPPNCNDGNVCTDDACNPAAGCINTNNTASCSDGNACTTGDVCHGGTCLGGPPPDCNDGNLCTTDSCDPSTGLCSNTAGPDNTACSGGGFCCAGNCVDLNVAQSTSPTGIYPLSVKPGYAAVATITNCGACGNECGGASSCTTKLCVPSAAGYGSCRQYNRAQCSEARSCQGSLQALEPECAGADNDRDGLPAEWETPQIDPYTQTLQQAAGVDLNCDGQISDAGGDLIWHEPPSGDNRPDIYVQLDYMGSLGIISGYINDPVLGVIPEGPGAHEPPRDPLTNEPAVQVVREAFARENISLHVDPVLHVLTHAQLTYLGGISTTDPCRSIVDPVTGEPSVTMQSFKPANFDPRRRLGYHYVISAHDSCAAADADESSPLNQGSGGAEVGGNDMIISLGSRAYYQTQFCDPVTGPVSCCSPTDCCIGGESNWDPDCGTPSLPIQTNPYTCEGATGQELCVSRADKVRRFREWAGTFMHELGHNLGLCHDGAADLSSEPSCAVGVNPEPNQISSMNPLYQLPLIPHLPHNVVVNGQLVSVDPFPALRADFSRGLAGLNEAALDETVGLSSTWPYEWDVPRYIYQGLPATGLFPPIGVAVDWNRDGVFDTSVALDIDGDGVLSIIPASPNEWQALDLKFQCRSASSD
jgi:hypothetical protein